MRTTRFAPLIALAAAGLLWGTTVPLSKLALESVGPAWLTVARFGLAAPLLAYAARHSLREALRWPVLAWGAGGYGAVILLQNAGVERTSVTHAALLIGAIPVLVALLAAGLGRALVPPAAWAGFALALGGVALVAADGSAGSSLTGDGLVLLAVLGGAAFTVAQPGLLAGRDPVAVTAAQFLAATAAALPVALVLEGAPPASPGAGGLLAVLGLASAGTLVPFTLFAYGQARVAPEVAGAFLNLEPLVGAAVGAAAFGDPVGLVQGIGGAAIVGGIALSTSRLLTPD